MIHTGNKKSIDIQVDILYIMPDKIILAQPDQLQHLQFVRKS